MGYSLDFHLMTAGQRHGNREPEACMSIKGITQKLRTQVTTPSEDAGLFFTAALVCLSIVLVPPYGIRTLSFAILFAINLLNRWRILRKARASEAAPPESSPDHA
jgi:hypothetical protein